METRINQIGSILEYALTDTDINQKLLPRGFRILAMTCFWHKCNFSAIVQYRGREYYCHWKNNTVGQGFVDVDVA
jgi:hypothetical protein